MRYGIKRDVLTFIIICMMLITLNCNAKRDNPEDELSSTYIALDEKAPIASVTPASGSIITGSTQITVSFDESINKSTLDLSGSMVSGSDFGVWTTVENTDDTLIISPSSLWAAGTLTLTINCNDPAGNALEELNLEYVIDLVLPTATYTPVNGTHINKDQSIVVTFSESINTGTLAMTGNMASESDMGTWTADAVENDTLTIEPASEWTGGADRTLMITCDDIAGNTLATITIVYFVAEYSGTVYVDSTGGDASYLGSSWDDAVLTIQEGIAIASDGMTVLVADGTYPANISFNGKQIHLMSANGPANCIIDGGGNSRGVSFENSETVNSIIEDFIIQNCNNYAVYCTSSGPAIRGCTIRNNTAKQAVYCQNSGAQIEDCIISGNSEGGVYLSDPDMALNNCDIINNTSTIFNVIAGMQIFSSIAASSITMENCNISGNSSGQATGGIIIYGSSYNMIFSLVDCNISNNSASVVANAAGGMWISGEYASGSVINSNIYGNNSDTTTGGIRISNNCNVTFVNCNIVYNITTDDSANTPGGIMLWTVPSVDIQNSIIWGNESNYTTCDQIYDSGVLSLYNCAYQNDADDVYVSAGTGIEFNTTACINDDPLFIDSSADDFHLIPDSPCLDAGNNTYVPAEIILDPDGNNRFRDGDDNAVSTVDIGVYEGKGYLTVPAAYATIQAAINASVNGDYILVANGTYTGDGNRNINFNGKSIVLKSAGGAANCIIDCQSSGRGFIFESGEDNDTILDGFTISNGYVLDTDYDGYGAGIFCSYSSPLIKNCIIKDNISNAFVSSPTAVGGGLYYYSSSEAVLINCLITGNSTLNNPADGGGIAVNNSSVQIINCTISGNTAWFGGGIYFGDETGGIANGMIAVQNSIIYGNTTRNGIARDIGVYGICSLEYCCIAGSGSPYLFYYSIPISISIGVTNDPLFVGSGDYHLQNSPTVSPCKNTGSNSLIPSGISTDLDGNSRIFSTAVDMGAYEIQE